jgi:DNA-binding transcriptional regulator PaaX
VFNYATIDMDSTRTLLFGIFVLTQRKLTAAEVIALAKPLKLSATNIKSHLTRMVAEGALQRSGPVRRMIYWPSASQSNVVEGITMRLTEPRSESWDRTWLILMLQMPKNRQQRDRLRASLWFDGFRPSAPSTFVRPAWPLDWTLRKARQYLSTNRGSSMRGKFVGAHHAANASAAYELDSLNREAIRLARCIRRMRIPATASNASAFAMRLKVGGLVASLVGHDPRLPAVIWGKRNGMHQLVRTFRKFETHIAPQSQHFVDDVIRATKR